MTIEYNPIMANIATAFVILLSLALVSLVVCCVYIGVRKRRKLSEISDRRKGWR